jgi:hypothetical protein
LKYMKPDSEKGVSASPIAKQGVSASPIVKQGVSASPKKQARGRCKPRHLESIWQCAYVLFIYLPHIYIYGYMHMLIKYGCESDYFFQMCHMHHGSSAAEGLPLYLQ